MRSEFNVLVKPLSTVKQVRSDSRNGYFIASEAWGTCFIRVSNTRECIEIYSHEGPNAQRTYTKIPAALTEKTYKTFCGGKNRRNVRRPAQQRRGLVEPFRNCVLPVRGATC